MPRTSDGIAQVKVWGNNRKMNKLADFKVVHKLFEHHNNAAGTQGEQFCQLLESKEQQNNRRVSMGVPVNAS